MCQEKALFEASRQIPEEQSRDAASLPGIDEESAALDALELQPTEMVEALQNRAIMYAALGELRRALHYFDMALTRFPRLETEELQRHRGVILTRLGETDRAREAFSRALEIDPSSDTAQDYLEALGTT
jgi:tetratricopeptide (TPR) repeat protein